MSRTAAAAALLPTTTPSPAPTPGTESPPWWYLVIFGVVAVIVCVWFAVSIVRVGAHKDEPDEPDEQPAEDRR